MFLAILQLFNFYVRKLLRFSFTLHCSDSYKLFQNTTTFATSSSVLKGPKYDFICLWQNRNWSEQDVNSQLGASFLKEATCAFNVASSFHIGISSISFSHICFMNLFGKQKGYESLEDIDVATTQEFNSSVFEIASQDTFCASASMWNSLGTSRGLQY